MIGAPPRARGVVGHSTPKDVRMSPIVNPLAPDDPMVAQVVAALPEAARNLSQAAQQGHKLHAINWQNLIAKAEAAAPEILAVMQAMGVLSGTPLSVAQALLQILTAQGVIAPATA